MNRNSSPKWSESDYFTVTQLSFRSNIEFGYLAKLIENQVIVADGPSANLYSRAQLTRLQRVRRLIKDIELETGTVRSALILLERIDRLENRLGWLQLAMLGGQNSTIH